MTTPTIDHTYRARLVAAHDGDTCTLAVDVGFDITYRAVVRVARINAPELATPAGQAAQRFALAWLTAAGAGDWPLIIASEQALKAIGTEKYGRWLALIYRTSDGAELGAALIAAGMAKVWNGQGVKPV